MTPFQPIKHLQLPQDLKKMDSKQLSILCGEIRQQIIQTVSKNGGHLASNLGAVELTVALHKVFQIPEDAIVWDVGHQCYTHKILTGRFSRFHSLRKTGGISGFPRHDESSCDAFLAGHASTSLSAACGLAKAKTLTGDPHTVIAVVGDGALTGGMIYEALNNAGRSGSRLIMILNDNNMSISKSVGALARYLAMKRTSAGYLQLKDRVEDTLLKIPFVGQGIRDTIVSSKSTLRQVLYHSNLFEDFGFDYLGPVDGHNISGLIQVLTRAKELEKPVVVHINTIKGKGYLPAEKNPARYHGVSAFDYKQGIQAEEGTTFSSFFGQTLVDLARKDTKICAITAAMETGTGLAPFAKEFGSQDRFFDVGIAEEHAVTFACGLAAGGMRPVVAVYSTFLQRAYDQLLHDGAIEPQHVVLAVDRAGFIGSDGATHQGLFDAAFLSQVPGITIYSPATYNQLVYSFKQAMYEAEGLAAVRYPRGQEDTLSITLSGDWTHCSKDSSVLLITYGRQAVETVKAVETLAQEDKPVDLLVLNQICPIPQECIQLARKYPKILFIEEGILQGGIGEHFLCMLSEAPYYGRMQVQGVKQPFLPQMTLAEAQKLCGLDAASIVKRIIELFF